MIKKTIYFLLLFWFIPVFSQIENDSLQIKFNISFDNSKLELNKKYVTTNLDTVEFQSIKFYISNINLYFKDKSKFSSNKSFLIDIENKDQNISIFSKKELEERAIEKISFQIGIDSITNVSGALGGDLDVMKGMYWAWQSGYINIKIEGKSSSCKTFKNKFQYHIGGYLSPYNALKELNFDINSNNLNFNVSLSDFFKEIMVKKDNSIMHPSEKSVHLATIFSKIIQLE